MKFEVSSTRLFAQLQTLSRVIAPKPSIPVLGGILFELHENILTLTASDSEITIRTSVIVDAFEGEGKVVFGGKLLVDTLKEFSEQPLSFIIDDQNFKLIIKSQNGNYSFVGINGNEYPEIAEMPAESRQMQIPAHILLDGINQTIYCTLHRCALKIGLVNNYAFRIVISFLPLLKRALSLIRLDAIKHATLSHNKVRLVNAVKSTGQIGRKRRYRVLTHRHGIGLRDYFFNLFLFTRHCKH